MSVKLETREYHIPPETLRSDCTQTTPPTPSSTSDKTSIRSSSAVVTPSTSPSSSFLLKAPPEVLHPILRSSGAGDPKAIASVAKSCRELRSFIYETPDQALWRDIHLERFDDPRLAGAFTTPRERFEWRKRVQDRVFVERIFTEWGEDRYAEIPQHLDMIVSTLLDMYLDLPASSDAGSSHPRRSSLDRDDTSNGSILVDILRSPLWTHIYFNLSTRETKPLLRPLRAQPGNPNRRAIREAVNPGLMRLHGLLSPDFLNDDEEHRTMRGYLREVVYSSQNYSETNGWGPFQRDGTVDWSLVDAVGSVMMSNAKDFLSMGDDGWRQAVLPLSYGIEPVRGWGFNDLHRPSELGKDEIWDWAGVEGRWCGSYAFLDYTDWISLNEPRLVQLRRNMNTLDLSKYHEAVGDLMRLDLTIDRPETGSSQLYATHPDLIGLPKITTDLPTSDLLPPIRFHGSSVQSNGNSTYPSQAPASFVRGLVQLTADDPPEVRWTLVIRYGGEDRWRLECVQVGGRGSKRGFFGIWTDALKEEHSPNGPVWYWKP